MPDEEPRGFGALIGRAAAALQAEGQRFTEEVIAATTAAFTPAAEKCGEPVGCEITVDIKLNPGPADNQAPEPNYVVKCRKCGKEYDVKAVVTPHTT